MNTSGEVADLMAKEAIQMTESAVKLTALGVKKPCGNRYGTCK